MSKHPHADPPSGPNPLLSSKTGIRLTVPEFVSVLAAVAFAVLGWARLDGRLSRIEDRMTTVEGRADRADHTASSRPILAEPEHGN